MDEFKIVPDDLQDFMDENSKASRFFLELLESNKCTEIQLMALCGRYMVDFCINREIPEENFMKMLNGLIYAYKKRLNS